MKRHDAIRHHLSRIEQVLREHQQWQAGSPQESAFSSTQPFFMDTMEPAEWLQWVFIPRMTVMLTEGHPLPESFAIAPYYEMALQAQHPGRGPLLEVLSELDALFTGSDA